MKLWRKIVLGGLGLFCLALVSLFFVNIDLECSSINEIEVAGNESNFKTCETLMHEFEQYLLVEKDGERIKTLSALDISNTGKTQYEFKSNVVKITYKAEEFFFHLADGAYTSLPLHLVIGPVPTAQ